MPELLIQPEGADNDWFDRVADERFAAAGRGLNMDHPWKFVANRIGELLWVKPLLMCFVSLAAALLASLTDSVPALDGLPEVSFDSVKTLLSIISSSMLVIATFAVGSMVSAYASATTTATPRAFSLIVADDASQNALSVFIGAFIFSIIGLIALLNGLYDKAGRFSLFVLTLLVFGIVIFTFVRWVDRIARLGRLETSMNCVETATIDALDKWINEPNLGGIPVTPRDAGALAVLSERIGYVQHIEIEKLQRFAQDNGCYVEVASLPGKFVGPQQVIAFVSGGEDRETDLDFEPIVGAFRIGKRRTFDEDPRFGLIVLSEIASRALSPGINDAGTAIQVIGSLVRILSRCGQVRGKDEMSAPRYERVAVPELSMEKAFDDAFRSIARDGAASIEVMLRLQKGLCSLAACPNAEVQNQARLQARRALDRAEQALLAPEDLVLVREQAQFAQAD